MLIEVTSKTYLLIVIVLSVCRLINTQISRCNPTLCDCSNYLEDDYPYQNVISCPPVNATVRFEIMNYTSETYISRLGHPFIKTFIYCKTNDQLVFDVISQTNFEYFDSVQYIKCPAPFNSSLGHGMPILEELIFENDGQATFNEWKPEHFSGLTNLRTLDIETETLDQLPISTFERSLKLKEVTLKMKHPNLHLFPMAEKLYLGSVDVDNFDRSLVPVNTNVKSVNLFSSKLYELTNNVMEGFKEVEVLSLNSNSNISLNSDCLNSLLNLKEVSIYFNEITEVPKGLFNANKKMRKIWIESEKIKNLPSGIFSELPELSIVTVTWCQLEEIPISTFENSVNIQEINFASSKLTTLPRGLFANLYQLKIITLANNQIASLPLGLFDNLSKLEVLDLSRNALKSITAANIIVASNSLFIDLSLNEITDVTVDDLHIFEKNTTVQLGFNKITAFSGIVHLRQHIERYNSTVLLRENPFDCSTCDVFHVVQERGGEYDDPADFVTKPFNIDTFALKCSQPTRFAGKSVRHLDLSDYNYNCSLSVDNNFIF